MVKCSSYHKAYVRDGVEVGQCWGTKKRYPCFCEGNREECDYYPEVREKAMADKVICPNCGRLHPKRYNLLSGTRGCGKSLHRAVDELDFCDMDCFLEWSNKYGIGGTIQNG